MIVDSLKLMGSDFFVIEKAWNEEEVLKIPSRTLAYIGDSVFELGLRMSLVRQGMDNTGKLHSSLVNYVSSTAQAEVFSVIFNEVSESEQILLKTWRNAKMPSRYGSGTKGEYARATALEAWVAYLFLTQKNDRLNRVFEVAKESMKTNEKK